MSLRKAVGKIVEYLNHMVDFEDTSKEYDELAVYIAGRLETALDASDGVSSDELSTELAKVRADVANVLAGGGAILTSQLNEMEVAKARAEEAIAKRKAFQAANPLPPEEPEAVQREDNGPRMAECVGGDDDGMYVEVAGAMPVNAYVFVLGQRYQLRDDHKLHFCPSPDASPSV